jgi:hypothetical protein
MAEFWSDYADNVITDVDTELGNKYGKMNLRKFLSNPAKFADQPDFQTAAQGMRKETNAFIDGLLDGLQKERRDLDNALAKADSITTQITSNISMQAKQNKVPMIKPVFIERDQTRDVAIYIDNMDSSVLGLIEKLSADCTYISDNTATYSDKKIGEWLFGGRKSYILRVFMPNNQAMALQDAKSEINGLFDIAMEFVPNKK